MNTNKTTIILTIVAILLCILFIVNIIEGTFERSSACMYRIFEEDPKLSEMLVVKDDTFVESCFHFHFSMRSWFKYPDVYDCIEQKELQIELNREEKIDSLHKEWQCE